MKGIVYCHTNIINNKKYIGETTKELSERTLNGKGYSRRYKFGKAIDKYGWENFKTEILEEIYEDDLELLEKKLLEKEKIWIKHFDSCKNGYNTTEQGNSSYSWTQEMKDKLSKTNKGHFVTEETKRKISESNKGKKRPPISNETRLKLSQANKRRKIHGSRKGKHNSIEQNQKISKANKGRKLTAETILKRNQTRKQRGWYKKDR